MQQRWKRTLFGCLAGCGFVILVFIGSCVAFTAWLNAPAEVLEPRVLLGSETTGYAEWTLRLEDPGTAEFVDAMTERLSRLSATADSPLPDGLGEAFNAWQRKSAQKDMQRLFPMVVAWTTRPTESLDDDEHLFTVSARGVGHQLILLDWMFGFIFGRAQNVETVRYGGDKVFLLEEVDGVNPVVFIHRGIAFIVTDLDSAKRTLDRLNKPLPEPLADGELQSLFGTLPDGPSLRGALTNRNGEVRRLLQSLDVSSETLDSVVWSDVRGLTLIGALESSGGLTGALDLHGPNPSWAADHLPILGPGLEALFANLKLEFETTTTVVNEVIRVEFRSPELLNAIQETQD